MSGDLENFNPAALLPSPPLPHMGDEAGPSRRLGAAAAAAAAGDGVSLPGLSAIKQLEELRKNMPE